MNGENTKIRTNVLLESGLRFAFSANWQVKQYDTHAYYKALVSSGMKAVDFLGIYEDRLYLIEVKNYRYRFEGQPDIVQPSAATLAETIITKTQDSIRAIQVIQRYHQRKWLYRLICPLLLRLPARWLGNWDWVFWTKAYELLERKAFMVVLWVEMDEDFSKAERVAYRIAIAELLREAFEEVEICAVNRNGLNETLVSLENV